MNRPSPATPRRESGPGSLSTSTRRELVSDAPWAKSYRLSRGDEAAYLKLLPPHQASVLEPVAALARHFPVRIPKVLAYDAAARVAHFCTAWRPHAGLRRRERRPAGAGQDLRRPAGGLGPRAGVVRRVAQAGRSRSCPRSCWRSCQPQAGRAGSSAESTSRVAADYFLGAAEAARYHRALHRRVDLLQRHLEAADALPPTINHGDLRPPNAAIDPTIFGGWGLIVGGFYLGFPTDWGAGFRGFWAGGEHGLVLRRSRTSCAAQDEAYWAAALFIGSVLVAPHPEQ